MLNNTQHNPANFLESINVNRTIGTQAILKEVSFSLKEGEVYCIVGPSGSGKSSLLKIIAGIDAPDSGEVTLQGETLTNGTSMLPPEKRRMNMVFQDYALWPHMKVKDIVGYGLTHLKKAEKESRIQEMLALLKITQYSERYPRELSGGQAQRVSIARAIATNPDVLLFDEPLSNLDVQLRTEMRSEFSNLFKRLNKTVLYVTHDPLEACAFADKIIVMKEGEIEQIASPQDLFSAPKSPWIASLAGFDCQVTVDNLALSDDLNQADLRINDQKLTVNVAAQGPLFANQMRLWLRSSGIRVQSELDSSLEVINTLTGKVKENNFEGSHWRIDIQVNETTVLPLLHHEQLKNNQTVQLVIPTEHCLLMNQ
ncbi:hypothetical protein BCU68_11335 [Vibrio sp. 10N.286.49.B3]|uniref:ABC transporter ATP-binding protein n=1 Tax=Vibrio sp. 10N.286.49.B3 TaxID=1880855 RepID=UPI000C84AFB6|nr:ABC transporter ATP-binding protein [Vibrio sp. 10N.286.49.B3]PMH45026.1 hypothetical protein BCU68_11335 [Vibrio sp. 10N.286.49.B3]